MPMLQPMPAIDILTRLRFLHSLKSLSTSPGSGLFPSCLEALAILRISLLTGITVSVAREPCVT